MVISEDILPENDELANKDGSVTVTDEVALVDLTLGTTPSIGSQPDIVGVDAIVDTFFAQVQSVGLNIRRDHHSQVNALAEENKLGRLELAGIKMELDGAKTALAITQMDLGQAHTRLEEIENQGQRQGAEVAQLTQELHQTHCALSQAREIANVLKIMYNYAKAQILKLNEEQHQDRVQLHYHS